MTYNIEQIGNTIKAKYNTKTRKLKFKTDKVMTKGDTVILASSNSDRAIKIKVDDTNSYFVPVTSTDAVDDETVHGKIRLPASFVNDFVAKAKKWGIYQDEIPNYIRV